MGKNEGKKCVNLHIAGGGKYDFVGKAGTKWFSHRFLPSRLVGFLENLSQV
jgi:hypothetical protein